MEKRLVNNPIWYSTNTIFCSEVFPHWNNLIRYICLSLKCISKHFFLLWFMFKAPRDEASAVSLRSLESFTFRKILTLFSLDFFFFSFLSYYLHFYNPTIITHILCCCLYSKYFQATALQHKTI